MFALKVVTAVTCLNLAQKVAKYLDYFYKKKICHQDALEISQSGHTAGNRIANRLT